MCEELREVLGTQKHVVCVPESAGCVDMVLKPFNFDSHACTCPEKVKFADLYLKRTILEELFSPC